MIIWLTGILCGTIGLFCPVAPVAVPTETFGAFAPVSVSAGGTGSTTLSGILIGNGTSPVKTLTIGTNLTLTGTTLDASGGATSAFEIATGTIAVPELAYITKVSGRTTLGSVATGTASCTTGASCTSFTVIGSSPSITTTLGTAVDLASEVGATRLPFANLTQGAANTVLANVTGATADFAALATSSLFAAGTAGQVLTYTSAGTWIPTSTSTLSTISGTLALTQLATQAANTVVANGTGGTAAPTAVATSTFFGTPTGGFILAFNGGKWVGAATSTITPTAPVTATFSGGDWAIGCATCLTANQSITLTGAVTGSGATSITTAFGTLANGVLANALPGATIPIAIATSTLYGAGGIPTSALAAFAANTVLANGTGASAVPTAYATSSLFVWNGTGSVLRTTNAALVTPDLGTPTALVLTNATGLPVAGGGTGASTLTGLLQGNGTSAFTALTDSSTVGQILRVTGASTYAWGALNLADTDAITGDLPFANLAQVSANSVLGNITSATSDAASIATSSLFQWTGTGQVVRGTSPTLVTPALGTPSALVGTNITGTAASLTAGLATALAANGANCSAGNYPLGVDALGAVESCTAAGSGGANSKWATTTAPDAFGIYLNSANKVGIGTSTPRWGLTASSSTAPQLTLTDASATAAPWNFRAIGNMLYISTSSPTTYATTSPAAISIDSTGKPGLSIGSTTPFATLAVNPVAGGFDNQMVVGSSSATSLRLDNSGHLFLPQLTQSGLTQTYNMCGAGTTFEAVWDTVTCLVSARKYKKDEQPISAVEALRVVMALRPLTYLKREPLNQTDAGRQPGFIADDVENVEPMLVSYDMQGEVRGFRYEQYTAYLTGAIQGQQDMIEKLTKRIEKLEQPNMCMYEY